MMSTVETLQAAVSRTTELHSAWDRTKPRSPVSVPPQGLVSYRIQARDTHGTDSRFATVCRLPYGSGNRCSIRLFRSR